MKKGMFSLAVAALLAGGAGSANAQGFKLTVDYLNSRSIVANNVSNAVVPGDRDGSSGGGFDFKITAADVNTLGYAPLQNVVLYCFGANQFIQDPTVYRALTFSEFTTWASGASAPSTYNQIDLANLQSMALRVSLYQAGSSTAIKDANGKLQEEIWRIAMDDVNSSPAPAWFDASNNYAVLIDDRFFSQRDFSFANGAQPMLVQIPGGSIVTPEPSTYALMGAGLLAIGFVGRRRKQYTA